MTALIGEINLGLYRSCKLQVRGKPCRMNACSLITPYVLAERSTSATQAELACKDQKPVGHLKLLPEIPHLLLP